MWKKLEEKFASSAARMFDPVTGLKYQGERLQAADWSNGLIASKKRFRPEDIARWTEALIAL